MDTIGNIRRKILETEQELARLRDELHQAEAAEQTKLDSGPLRDEPAAAAGDAAWKWPLSEQDYERYARQLIIPQVGVPGVLLSACFPPFFSLMELSCGNLRGGGGKTEC